MGRKNFHRSLGRDISPQLSIYKAIYRDPRPLHSYNLNVGIAGPPLGGQPTQEGLTVTAQNMRMAICHGTRKQNTPKIQDFWNFDFQSCPSDEANDAYTCDLDLKTTTVQAPTLNVSASGSHARKFVGSLPSQHGSGPDDWRSWSWQFSWSHKKKQPGG